MDSGGTSQSGLGNYVSLAELAAESKVSVQTIYDLRSRGCGPQGFRVGTPLRFRKSEVDAWVERTEQADEQRHAGGAA
ncbi:helix-turn-helix domain-containing protein [Microbacterium oleivorans]|nr:helix-turn-helix domain-containing protein [Microbacterium sp. ARD31]MDT0178827.1 helix-turn-helix domain-containing protein [Microbacterium sp. ARD31]